jgi:hypothetical protein
MIGLRLQLLRPIGALARVFLGTPLEAPVLSLVGRFVRALGLGEVVLEHRRRNLN